LCEADPFSSQNESRAVAHQVWRALISKFEVQINDNTQYRGKKTPYGKKGDCVEPVSHHKKQQRQSAKDIDYLVTRKEGTNTCCRKIEHHHRNLIKIW